MRDQRSRIFLFNEENYMAFRGIRGATTINNNNKEEILSATRELIIAIQDQNPDLKSEDLASVIFSVTEDISAAFPAIAARQSGWQMVPFLCCQEIPVPGSLQSCIRILLHWNTDLMQDEIQHVYLRKAASLRPDLTLNKTLNSSIKRINQ